MAISVHERKDLDITDNFPCLHELREKFTSEELYALCYFSTLCHVSGTWYIHSGVELQRIFM